MGHGPSVLREPSLLRIACVELQEGSLKLSRDFTLRLAFVKFIKSGEWLDDLAVLVPQNLLTVGRILPRDSIALKDIISTYQLVKEQPSEVESSISWSTLSSFTRSFSRPVTPISPRRPEPKLESYVNIDDCPCFNGDQYLAILFHVLYPIYLVSPQYRRFLKHGIEHGRPPVDEDCGSVISHSKEKVTVNGVTFVPCPQAQRLQDILLGCAAYFDESMLEKRLAKPDWLDQVNAALDHHFLAISVMDIRKEKEKFVYANKAFQAMTEYTTEDLLNKDLSLLNGPNTEGLQILLLRAAMKSVKTAKLGITFYTKSKRAFTDLVAVKTTTQYSVAVHFAALKGADLIDLKEVDDLLILVSQLLQPSVQTADVAPPARHHRSPLAHLEVPALPRPSFE